MSFQFKTSSPALVLCKCCHDEKSATNEVDKQFAVYKHKTKDGVSRGSWSVGASPSNVKCKTVMISRECDIRWWLERDKDLEEAVNYQKHLGFRSTTKTCAIDKLCLIKLSRIVSWILTFSMRFRSLRLFCSSHACLSMNDDTTETMNPDNISELGRRSK